MRLRAEHDGPKGVITYDGEWIDCHSGVKVVPWGFPMM